MLSGLGNAMHAKWHMATCTLWSYGLGYHQLGFHCYTNSGHNSIHGHFALVGIKSHPAPLLCSLGKDNN